MGGNLEERKRKKYLLGSSWKKNGVFQKGTTGFRWKMEMANEQQWAGKAEECLVLYLKIEFLKS